MSDVCLVSMPYGSVARPSIALGVLRTLLERAGIPTAVRYPNLWWCERIGVDRYHMLSHRIRSEYLAAEWSFAQAAFRSDAPDPRLLLDLLREQRACLVGHGELANPDRFEQTMLEIRSAAVDFVDETARRILETGARIVGCTSTFEQHVASLALLRRVRELDPSVLTVMGGANCDAVMGDATQRAFPWVDFVVVGDGDGLIVDLIRSLLASGRDALDLPAGVLGPSRPSDPDRPMPRVTFRNLDAVPIPDYDDYFEALRASPARAAIRPGLPVEFSRGCWWGAVHHCTFCGLNGSGMVFGAKSADRVREELEVQGRRYGIYDFEAADNILDTKYYKTLLPDLAERRSARSIFFQIKANVTRAQVSLMARAGVTWVQAGVESLHSAVLGAMDKGVQGWQNIQLLRWAREFGIRVSWAILWDLPGEDDAWYAEMADFLPLLEHLQAPSGMLRLRYDRYSVYHNRAAEFGLNLRPVPAMRAVYPLAEAELNDLAYCFEDGNQEPLDVVLGRRPGASRVRGILKRWHAAFHAEMRPVLSPDDRDGVLRILDTRSCATEICHEIRDLEREVLLACDAAPSRARLPKLFPAVAEEAVGEALEALRRRRLVLEVDGRVLSLTVAGELPDLPDIRQYPGGFVEDLPRQAWTFGAPKSENAGAVRV